VQVHQPECSGGRSSAGSLQLSRGPRRTRAVPRPRP
jgi:hypothetical protein